MKIASNSTDKILSTVFCKFAEEIAFVLECNIAYMANWYFGSDYMSVASNALQNVIQIVLRKRKNCSLYKLVSNWEQIMLYTKS